MRVILYILDRVKIVLSVYNKLLIQQIIFVCAEQYISPELLKNKIVFKMYRIVYLLCGDHLNYNQNVVL